MFEDSFIVLAKVRRYSKDYSVFSWLCSFAVWDRQPQSGGLG